MNDVNELEAERAPEHPSALDLERLAFDPQGAHVGSNLEAHVGGCDRCGQRVQALRADRAAFLVRHPAARFAASVETSRARTAWEKLRAALLGLAAVGAMAGIAWLALPSGSADERVHFKGAAPTLEVFVSRNGAPAVAMAEGEPLYPGDVLRWVVSTSDDAYLFVANLDDQGRFTQYFPSSGRESQWVRKGARVPLEGSIALDDFIGEERITLLVSSQPLEAGQVEAALQRAFREANGLRGIGALELPADSVGVVHRKERR
jgi:hypothetical protein